MQSFGYRHDLHTLFDDFLSLILSCISVRVENGESADEHIFKQVKDKYTDHLEELNFPELFAILLSEMELRVFSSEGNDVLGEFYEANLAKKRKGQFFTPYPVCRLMAECVIPKEADAGRKSILDPCCGSGRTLIATAHAAGHHHEFYGVDIDPTCAKMTAINLFLNGIFQGEVICADALNPEHFVTGYRLSARPFGIERITEKESSELWLRMKANGGNVRSPFLSVQQELP